MLLAGNTNQTLISIYWAGALARQNLAVDEMMRLVEKGYNCFISSFKDSSIIQDRCHSPR